MIIVAEKYPHIVGVDNRDWTGVYTINGVIENTCKVHRGLMTAISYWLGSLLSAGDHCPYRLKPTDHPQN